MNDFGSTLEYSSVSMNSLCFVCSLELPIFLLVFASTLSFVRLDSICSLEVTNLFVQCFIFVLNRLLNRYKKCKIENCGNDMRIAVKKSPKRTAISQVNECYSMAVHSSMQSCRKGSTNGMRTSAACSVLASTLPNTVRKAISTCTASAVASAVPRIKINRAIRVQGICDNFASTLLAGQIVQPFSISGNCCCAESHWVNHFCNSAQ